MSKRLSQPISISLNARNQPVSFKWRERIYRVKDIQEVWRVIGAWWDGEGETTFFRITTDKGGIYEIAYNHAKSAWTLESVRD